MSRRVHVLLLSVAIVVAACQDSPNPAGPEPDASSVPNLAALKGQAAPGRYIVMFQDAVGSSAAVAGSMVAGRGRLHLVYDGAVKGFAADLSDAAAAELRRDPRVSFVEPDRVVSTLACSPRRRPGGSTGSTSARSR